jgi:GNAT acetyltransferase-like protein
MQLIHDKSFLNCVDPLTDARWSELLSKHPRASVFHTAAWLDALQRSYGYRPVAYSTSAPGFALRDGLVLCEVKSWLTGARVVSLPFSDHCDPLIDDPQVLAQTLATLQAQVRDDRWRYLEIRPLNELSWVGSFASSAGRYFHHQIDLSPSLDSLFRNFHKNSTQRKITRAERETLSYQEGASELLLKSFYSLFVITRRRHHIPPQPLSWFRNLIACFKEALQIRVAFKNDQAVAAILTLQYKNTLTYKYGCSDPRFNRLGGTQMLFWKAIQEAKTLGLTSFDLGRSDADNTGLVNFKDRLGAVRSEMSYLRYYPHGQPTSGVVGDKNDWKLRLAKPIFARSPDKVLRVVGRLLYKHIG